MVSLKYSIFIFKKYITTYPMIESQSNDNDNDWQWLIDDEWQWLNHDWLQQDQLEGAV